MSVGKQLHGWVHDGKQLGEEKLRKLVAELLDRFGDMTETAAAACKLAEERGEEIAELKATAKLFENLATAREREMKHATGERKRAERVEQDALSENRRLEAKVKRLEAAPPGDPELEQLAREMLASRAAATETRKRMTRLLKERDK